MTTLSDNHSRHTDTRRKGLCAVLVLAAALFLLAPPSAMAQGATPFEPPSVTSDDTVPAEPTAPAASDPEKETTGSQAQPDASPQKTEHPAQSTVAPEAEAGTTAEGGTAAPAATDTAPQAEDGPDAAVTEDAPLEPTPSLLEDPVGAISHMLNAESEPNLPHDLSPWGMFKAADWVVKTVIMGLALGSLAVWTVWLAKSIEIACAKGRARRAVAAIASGANLADASRALVGRGGPGAFMVRSAEEEVHRSAVALDHAGNDGVKERVAARLARIEAQAGRRLARGTGMLATVGSTAPFVGLFGTVWGIMNAFVGISEAQTTNLAVVAPGIAEALLATAMGLVAAIPAVITYNVFARSITGYGQLLADAASGIEQLVSLDLDLRQVPAYDPGSPVRAQAAE